MNRKLEEKILDEIRKRVLEKDSELKEQEEDKLIRDSNIEALTELTNLSKKEVENIAKSVRTEVQEAVKKQRKKYINIGIAISVLILIFAIIFWPEAKLKEIIVEDEFSNNDYNWDIYNDFKYKKNIKDGYYYMETNVDDWCYWDNVNVDFPKNYDVLLTSLWKYGKFESYGLALSNDNDNYCTFQIRADGTAAYGKVINDKWVYEGTWKNKKANTSETKKPNIQLVEVRNNKFKYYVNNNLVEEGEIDLNFKNICIRACGKQLVAFDNLKIINSDNKKIVFEDNFENASTKWSPSEKIIKQSFFKDGEYIFKISGESCYWAVSQKHQISNNCEIEISSTWLNGETANYGIMIMENNSNYISCEIKSDGNVRLVTSIKGEYININDYTKTKYVGNGSLKHTQKIIIKDNKIEYYIDNEFIQTTYLADIIPIKIGLRVCEKQSVAFDKIKITTFE